MHRSSSAVRAISAIALASAPGAAAAAEDKSTKPRIAVIEFTNQAGHSGPTRIEILSWSWGDANAIKLEPTFIKSWSTSGDAAPPPPRSGGFNQMSMDDTAGKEKSAAPTAVSHDLRTNVIARTAPPPGSAGDPDRPVIAGSVPNPTAAPGANQTLTVGGGRSETAFDRRRLPAGSKLAVRVTRPLAKGSVWVRVASPWAACEVGARYPSLRLASGDQAYTLEDVTVASCGDADDRPTEEVAFTYNKVKVRGWDPEKKEE